MKTFFHSGVVLLVLSHVTPVAAQDLVEAELRQGYYLGVAASGGVGRAEDGDLGGLGSGLELGGRLRIGQMFSPDWGAGFLLLGGVTSTRDFSGVGGGVGLELTLYPFDGLDLALRPSVGLLVNGYSRDDSLLETSDDPMSLYAARIANSVTYDLWCWSDAGESGGMCLTAGVDFALGQSDDLRTVSAVGLIEVQQFWGLAKERLLD
ncbi:MAG: hypothetical protein AAF658_15125 [Myxococcota bacterium]